ncbi:TIMELESS-interacting protein [Lissotriton helveticus]
MADPMENSLFDIPDYEHTEDETFAAFPPPASPGDGDGGHLANGMDDWDGNQGSPKAEELPQPARKKVKRNIPKLDADRLVSERGLPALRTMFNDTKFKGKGHEAEDLKLLLRHMEHWAHRLYPKLTFEDFINKLEALGSKKPVQTCLKRIRMDLPIVHNDFTSQEGVQLEEQSNGVNMPSDEFDMHLPSKAIEPSPGHLSVKVNSPPSSQSSPSLSEELRLRIERNKQLALERRMAKIQNSSQTQEFMPSPLSAPPVAEVKIKDAQELDDDMDDEFLEVLVASAAETEASVMDCAASASVLDDASNSVALEVANLNTKKATTDEVAATSIVADVPAIACRKEAAEAALVKDAAVKEVAETSAMEDAAVKEAAETSAMEDAAVKEAAETSAMEDAADTMVDIDKGEDATAFITEMTLAEISVDTAVSDKDTSVGNVFEEPVHKVAGDYETFAAKVGSEAAKEQEAVDKGTSETNLGFAEDRTAYVSARTKVDNTDAVVSSADDSTVSAVGDALHKGVVDIGSVVLDSAVDTANNGAFVKDAIVTDPAFVEEAASSTASGMHEKEAISMSIDTPQQNPLGID